MQLRLQRLGRDRGDVPQGRHHQGPGEIGRAGASSPNSSATPCGSPSTSRRTSSSRSTTRSSTPCTSSPTASSTTPRPPTTRTSSTSAPASTPSPATSSPSPAARPSTSRAARCLPHRVYFKDVERSKLIGHGVLYNNPGGAILCEGSKNIRVENVHHPQPGRLRGHVRRERQRPHQEGTRVQLEGQRRRLRRLLLDPDHLRAGCFMRNSDDCIAIYCHRWNYYGDTRDITVKNCTLWADVAHPINVGTHGNTDAPETIENLVIKNIDILDHREPQMNYQGCIALNPGDSNLIRNVRIEDVRIEDFRWGQVIYMKVMYNTKYNTSVGRGIDGVYVKNLSYTGTHANPSLFLGYDAERAITNVTFENLVINGLVVADSMKKPSWYYTTDAIQWFYNEHVTNLKFLTTAEAEAAAAS
ncbi:hypothetical protein ACRAWF_12055 [Streptomyces sp. L7]